MDCDPHLPIHPDIPESDRRVTKTIPSYLKLHRAPAPSSGKSANNPPQTPPENVDSFWDAYSEATGWRIDPSSKPEHQPMSLLPAVNVDPMQGVETDGAPAVSRSSALRLAESAAKLAEQLHQSREALRLQEAELAARAAIVIDQPSRTKLADKIEKTLTDAAATCRCSAAAMYLLDDDTKYLKTRAVHGLDAERLESPSRELRGSRADLEALVQGVVMIDDLSSTDAETWCVPEPAASAICASIQQDDLPIGTLWLLSDQPQSFSEADAAAARLAASQLALELTNAASGKQKMQWQRGVAALRDISEWQYQTLPVGSILAEGWTVDGMVESPQDWVSGWHAWDVLPDGTLMISIAEAVDTSIGGAMTATIARAALSAHSGYRHTPKQMLQRVSDTLWQTSTGEQLVSMMYLRLDPESGEGEVAAAGKISAMIGSRYGYRPLVNGNSEPLATNMDVQSYAETFRMMPGESLVAYGPGVVSDGGTQTMIGEAIRSAMQDRNHNSLSVLRRKIAKQVLGHERGLVSLTRS